MAKTYLDIVKYMVEAKFEINGLVEKPDIIGAVFGQTEGLLGDDLDLRELQKGGKIGRIEIDASQSGNKTYGNLYLPASLDKIETCVLAAAVESVDRVGPYEANFQVSKIEDTRAEKRRKLLERAKDLLRKLLTTEIPDSKELTELVESDVKASEIATYGPERLPSGPDIAKESEIILVEGRADVINLLKNDITNVVALGGATAEIPKSIIKLCNEKEVTLFVDGDRGGEMIARGVINAAEVDFVARAPDGKEVEELTRKEIIKAIRSKVPIDQYLGLGRNGKKPEQEQHQQAPQQQPQRPQQQAQQPQQPRQPQQPQAQPKPTFRPEQRQEPAPAVEEEELPVIKDLRKEYEDENEELPVIEPQKLAKEPQGDRYGDVSAAKPALDSILLSQLAKGLDDLANTLRCRLYNVEGNVIVEGPIRDLFSMIENNRGVYGIVLDGTITQRLVALALERNIKAIYGIRANPMPRKPPSLTIYTKEQGPLE
ncbi:MAG: DNA primase DnaG [Candidatus Micrarchaeia archaeon]